MSSSERALPDIRGLEELEGAVLDESASLASALRRCLMLGGYAHHQELRYWALKELDGYRAEEELPEFRRLPAALEVSIDLHLPGQILQNNRRRISVNQLPQAARERGVGESAPIRMGVKEIEDLVARSERGVVHISPPSGAEFALLMTQQQAELGNEGADITGLYWQVSVTNLQGILDRIRTRLTRFVAEVRASMPPGQQNPNPQQIERAAQQTFGVKSGDNSPITIVNSNADRGATATTQANEPPPQPFFQRTAVIWTAVGAIAAVAAAVIAWIALK
ncbi:hypothetical protein OG196_43995 (plasmid) [Kitasatospora purpeofusca]|uniref:AbiTii domain-containing protein n=1 Tax=Kitasatospora purpeofusca TaxID=67352 RepID=UPI002E14BB13|nr:hypothetical protein OG196_43995 [Kitasatospora purpeofusca]